MQSPGYGAFVKALNMLQLAAPALGFPRYGLECVTHILIAKNQPIWQIYKIKSQSYIASVPLFLRGNHGYKYKIRF